MNLSLALLLELDLANKTHNKALHRTAIPLRSIAAGELCRCAAFCELKGLQILSFPTQTISDDSSDD